MKSTPTQSLCAICAIAITSSILYKLFDPMSNDTQQLTTLHFLILALGFLTLVGLLLGLLWFITTAPPKQNQPLPTPEYINARKAICRAQTFDQLYSALHACVTLSPRHIAECQKLASHRLQVLTYRTTTQTPEARETIMVPRQDQARQASL